MDNISLFSSTSAVACTQLTTALSQLSDWQLVQVNGEEAEKYLQGQLTCDMPALTSSHYTHAAHCDAKGKVWSNLLLFKQEQQYFYIVRKSVASQQVAELKKYAVFSKAKIDISSQHTLLGLSGSSARHSLQALYSQLPDKQQTVVHYPNASILVLEQPCERFLLVVSHEEAQRIIQHLDSSVTLTDSHQWLSLDIEAGIPIVDLPNSNEFLPQALNLDKLNGICFSKGCYLGQEMIARAKYRGANKRELYLLSGHSDRLPEVGEALEMNIDGNFRLTGTVLAAVMQSDKQVVVQAVLNNDLTTEEKFRVPSDENSHLAITQLIYA